VTDLEYACSTLLGELRDPATGAAHQRRIVNDVCTAIASLPRLEKISLAGLTSLETPGRRAIRALVAAMPSPPPVLVE
jgi:hypothetical protein